MHKRVAFQETVQPVGADGRIVAEMLRDPTLHARGDIGFLGFPHPVPIAVADEAVPHDEQIARVVLVRLVRHELRAGRVVGGCVVDRGQHLVVRREGEYVDRRRVAERRIALREIHVHVEVGSVAERVFQVQDRAALLVAGCVPHDPPVGEAAALVAIADAGRIAERARVPVRRVALPQRDGPEVGPVSACVPLNNKDGVAADADVLRLVERAALHPFGAAVVPALRGDFLALEEVHAEGHAPVSDRAAPEDAALPAVAAVPGRQPDKHLRLDAVQVGAEHDVERAAHGMAVESTQAFTAQKLEALDGREGQGVQIARGRGVGPAVDQDEQRLPSGEEVADDAGLQQLLERLGAGTLDEIPLELGDDTRCGRQRAGMGGTRRECGDHGK